jgi:pimeloyl-ACP methyl ester carboxylesterase
MATKPSYPTLDAELLATTALETIYDRDGILLQTWGHGTNLVVFPGLEGSGESCLHLVLPVLSQALDRGQPFRLLLVNYAHEKHQTLEAMVHSINRGLAQVLGNDSCIFWAQSFGNLLATGSALTGSVHVSKFLMVSPFTRLPSLLARLSLASLYVTPTFLYRATIKPMGRYVFGPVGENGNHPFFDSLTRATTPNARRQTRWLVGSDFSNNFESIRVPAKVWLGEKDRLVNIRQQIRFFKDLAARKPNYHLSLIPTSGHVVLPHQTVEQAREELLEWLLETE